MRRTRVGRIVSSCALGLLLCAADAGAQQKAPPGPARSSTQFTLRREPAGAAEAQAARGRARAGDCAGALTAFDLALRTSTDPTLRRDRGLCHESLGNVFPAIDDYRVYLTARPDAPDSDQIRQRLAALEGQTQPSESSSSRSSVRERDRDDGGRSSGSASAKLEIGSGGASANAESGASTSDEPQKRPRRDYDVMADQEEKAETANASPLRYGKGFVLGPFVHLPRFWFGDGAARDLAYGVGGAFRYSTGAMLSIITELGYGGVGTSGETSSRAGPLLMAGVELRLPISRFASDHILLRGGLGYERHVISGTQAAIDNLLGRFGVGIRHVFGPSLGLELLFDGGPALAIPDVAGAESRVHAVIGGSLAFVVGF
jgi:hypothetical protein